MSDTGSQDQDFTPREQLRKGVGILFVLVLLTFFAVQFAIAAMAFSSWWLRAPDLLFSTLLMYVVLALAFSLVRRKLRAGRFLTSRAETLAKIVEVRNGRGAGNPFWQLAIHLVIPVIVCTVLIGAAVLVIKFAGCLCGNGPILRQRITLYAVAAVLLLLGSWGLFGIIRRRAKTGSFQPSSEELSKARAKCMQPKSLRQRILAAGIWCSIAAIWTGLAFHRPHHDPGGFSPWFLPVMAWFAAILYTWQVFRPTNPLCTISGLPDQSQTPPETPTRP